LARTSVDFIWQNTGCQVFAGNRVHISERAFALNFEPRRPTIAASRLSSTSAPRSPCKFADVRHGRVSRLLWRTRPGQCSNRLTIRRDEVEQRVLHALQDKLLRQDLFEEFCEEFTREMNRLRMEYRANLSSAERELERVRAGIRKVIDAIKDGFAGPELRAEMDELQARKESLLEQLATADAPVPLLRGRDSNQQIRHRSKTRIPSELLTSCSHSSRTARPHEVESVAQVTPDIGSGTR
jgi:hypothetical protein